MEQEKGLGQSPNKPTAFRKLGLTFMSAVIFGITAGLIIVVILSIFSQSSGSEGGKETEDRIVSVKETDEVETDFFQKNDTVSGSGIRVAESTRSDQTVVTDVTEVVDNVMPCVVSIFGTYVINESVWGYQFDYEAEGGGSGIIIGENETELLIVTNNHVVEDSKELTVQFIDDSVAEALVKGRDADMDLAVIAVDISDLDESTKEIIRVATVGNSDNLKVGEPAIAIGNALGYGQSVTTGVISAVNRSYTDEYGPLYKGGWDDEEDYDNVKYLIQTDAAINPGNSGGALLNVRGEVIGINSSKIASYDTEGMGYAIPISTAVPIIEDLMTQRTHAQVEEERSAYLGINGLAATGELLERHDIKKGLYITRVFPNTPAEKAGIKKGDILLSIEKMSVGDMDELSVVLSYYEEGEVVTVRILTRSSSGYREKELSVKLGGK
ncbi:MAG: trypsin-like peptidase domain-containing protein [Lachnospiraceae bacterium]|nr:trypsin-like peptidase domain-containing protein [Lachnospiraceae bacterium]